MLAQRRDADGEHGHAEVEILAELPVVHHAAQVTVGRGEEARLDRAVARLADAANGPRLQHSEQLRLRRERELSDLVEEHRAPLRRLEAADPRRHRAGEGSARMSEELRLEQILGERRAVDDDERLARAVRAVVNRARDQLLARTRLAMHEHRGLGRPDPHDRRIELAHRRAPADQRA